MKNTSRKVDTDFIPFIEKKSKKVGGIFIEQFQ